MRPRRSRGTTEHAGTSASGTGTIKTSPWRYMSPSNPSGARTVPRPYDTFGGREAAARLALNRVTGLRLGVRPERLGARRTSVRTGPEAGAAGREPGAVGGSGRGPGGRDSFQEAVGVDVSQGQRLQVDVADMAVAEVVGARAWAHGRAPGAVIQVAQRRGDEMAAADRAVAQDGD